MPIGSTYGYGRAEDISGLWVLTTMLASALLALYQAIQRLMNPRDIDQLGWVAVAGIVGFVGNELVALYRIRVGNRIGSAALVADGLHARTDGLTSLAVLLGAAGVGLGWRLADPIVGLVISAAIFAVLSQAAKEVFGRMLDRVDDHIGDAAEASVRHVDGVVTVDRLRMRWVGHELLAEAVVRADANLDLVTAHDLAHSVRDRLLTDVSWLVDATSTSAPPPRRRRQWTVTSAEPLVDLHRSSGGSTAGREQATAQYSFAVPNDTALDAIVRAAPNGIIELGAGTGGTGPRCCTAEAPTSSHSTPPPPPSPANR